MMMWVRKKIVQLYRNQLNKLYGVRKVLRIGNDNT